MSTAPSPLKSARANSRGLTPVVGAVDAVKVPSPSLRRMDTEFELEFVAAISPQPSPLTSAIPTWNGPDAVA